MFENLVALWVAIEKECTPEVAFKYVDEYSKKDANLNYNPTFKWSIEDMQDLINFREQGIAFKEIGTYYGMSDQCVYRALKRYEDKASTRKG